MPAFEDLTGRRFGRLVCVAYLPTGAREPNGRKVHKWVCQCDCGAMAQVLASNLRHGDTSSCGCFRRENTGALRRKHGMSMQSANPAPEYQVWKGMIARCTNNRHRSYHLYGGRGITVCQTWREDFAAFIAHIGRRPSPELTVERMDNDRGYEPGNVCWATRKQQRANQRRSE